MIQQKSQYLIRQSSQQNCKLLWVEKYLIQILCSQKRNSVSFMGEKCFSELIWAQKNCQFYGWKMFDSNFMVAKSDLSLLWAGKFRLNSIRDHRTIVSFMEELVQNNVCGFYGR